MDYSSNSFIRVVADQRMDQYLREARIEQMVRHAGLGRSLLSLACMERLFVWLGYRLIDFGHLLARQRKPSGAGAND